MKGIVLRIEQIIHLCVFDRDRSPFSREKQNSNHYPPPPIFSIMAPKKFPANLNPQLNRIICTLAHEISASAAGSQHPPSGWRGGPAGGPAKDRKSGAIWLHFLSRAPQSTPLVTASAGPIFAKMKVEISCGIAEHHVRTVPGFTL